MARKREVKFGLTEELFAHRDSFMADLRRGRLPTSRVADELAFKIAASGNEELLLPTLLVAYSLGDSPAVLDDLTERLVREHLRMDTYSGYRSQRRAGISDDELGSPPGELRSELHVWSRFKRELESVLDEFPPAVQAAVREGFSRPRRR